MSREQNSPAATGRTPSAAPFRSSTPPSAWFVWGAAAFAFAIAVFHRSSLGVAAVPAAERFEVGASVVATFVVVQLLVYSLAQIPVGLALDRYGSRLLITLGAFLMMVGQASMALAPDLGWAIAARVLVGAGDAMTFASAIRLVPAWFAPSRIPLITQITGLTGQFGQILSAVPLVALLANAGWRPAFLTAAATSAVACVVAVTLIRDRPPGDEPRRNPTRRPRTSIASVLRHPGTWLGASTHAATVFSPMVFAMMWGFPYLTEGEGRSAAFASSMLTLSVVLGLVFGPMVGFLTQRHPLRRSTLVILVILANALPFTLMVAWPGPAPAWLLVLWVVGLSSGGPGSAVAFDFARTFSPSERLGSATGIIIMTGFGVTLVTILGIGVVLDLQGGAYDLRTFRTALAVQFVPYALGIGAIVWFRTLARRRLRVEENLYVPTWREVWRREFGNRNWPRITKD
ncbi:MFS transporter [Kytococcus sedentarius]|uniref:MFS transporter n=1 Tax=Kytococcus sedentarius TaxID=1276 RepID=UPI0019501DBD|nr:MFS transporter [Kytococcus sedentarius]QRO86951.1 MFS transporter [Kytococcus sedentarius]